MGVERDKDRTKDRTLGDTVCKGDGVTTSHCQYKQFVGNQTGRI